jgi:hypothetical protein
MTKTGIGTAGTTERSRFGPMAPELSEEDKSKDAFFVQLGEFTEAMIARHGKEFAIGTLILSARFVAENRPLIKQEDVAATTSASPHVHKSDCSCC